MRLSWLELLEELSIRLKENNVQTLNPLLENVKALTNSYSIKPIISEHISSSINQLFQLMNSPSINSKIEEKLHELEQYVKEVVTSEVEPLMLA